MEDNRNRQQQLLTGLKRIGDDTKLNETTG